MFDILPRTKHIVLFLGVSVLLLSGCTQIQHFVDKETSHTIPLNTIDFNVEEQTYLLSVLRTKDIHKNIVASHANEVLVVLWEEGKKVGVGSGATHGLQQNIVQARNAALDDAGMSLDAMAGLDSHLFVLGPWQQKDTAYIHGVHALKMSYQGQEIVFRPSYAVETNRDYEKAITYMCTSLKGTVRDCERNDEVDILYAETLHLAQQAGETYPRTYYRGKVMTPKQGLTVAYVADFVERGKQWLTQNIDGKFTYVYNPSSGVYSKNNNMIRQFMGSRLLAEMAQDDATLQEDHKENLEYIFATWYQEKGEEGYVWYQNKSKLGAIAMLIRTLAVSPFIDEYQDELTKLTTTLLSLQQDDGSFIPWYIAPDYAYDVDYLLTFYSGEAIVALVELYEALGDERILDAALRAQDFYLQRYVEEIDAWYYPAYVPWHTLSLYKLYQITGNADYAEAIFVLNDKLIDEMLNTNIQGTPDILGRFYNPAFRRYGTPHSASDGVYVEGLVYAYMLAEQLKDTVHTEKYWQALELGIHNLVQLQYREGDMYFMRHPERVVGAVRFRADDNRIRTDTTQHALDGLRVLHTFLVTQ